jgi:hypothetical protein
MQRLTRLLPLIALFGLGGCTSAQAPGREGVATTEDAIHATAPDGGIIYLGADTEWPEVGFLAQSGSVVATPLHAGDDQANAQFAAQDRVCSGTLVAPRTVLVAAHCFAAPFLKCPNVGPLVIDEYYFAFNAAGSVTGPGAGPTQVYAIDDIRVAHNAFDLQELPNPPTPTPCTDVFARTLDFLDHSHDQALLHLAVAPGQPDPAVYLQSMVSGSGPIEMITSHTDQAYSPFGLHANVPGPDGSEPTAGVTAWEVGWAVKDSPPGEALRSSGVVAIVPTPATVFPPAGANVFYVNTANVSPDSGDSGGPAAIVSDGTGPISAGRYLQGPLTFNFGYPSTPPFAPWAWYTSTFFIDPDFAHSNAWWLESVMWTFGDYFDSTLVPGSNPGVVWAPIDMLSHGSAPIGIPTNFIVAGQNGGTTLGLCNAWFNENEEVGTLANGVCTPNLPGAPPVPIFKVLQKPQRCYLAPSWVDSGVSTAISSALQVGYRFQETMPPTVTSLFACQSDQGGGSILPGTLSNGVCLVNGSQQPTFRVLDTGALDMFLCGWYFAAGPVTWWDPGDPETCPWVNIASPAPNMAGEVLEQEGNAVTAPNVSPIAQTLLASVLAGTAQMFVGDDVYSGSIGANVGAVVVQPNTTGVLGGLSQAGGAVFGVTTRSVNNVDPPELRAFDATDQTLFALQIGTQTLLQLVDVNAALRGVVATVTTPITGVVPVAPLGMVWNRFTRSLVVADGVASGPRASLRLLTINPLTGESDLLWQTDLADRLPDSVMFSVNAEEEIVVGLIGVPRSGDTEVLIMDATGAALLSGDFDGRVIGPPHATPRALELSFKATQPRTLVRFESIRRGGLEPGLCGAQWLLAHSDAPRNHACGECQE